MDIRLYKCTTFGMMKIDLNYAQILPGLWIDGKSIPPVPITGEFKYLGKLFSFDMNNGTAKALYVTISDIETKNT